MIIYQNQRILIWKIQGQPYVAWKSQIKKKNRKSKRKSPISIYRFIQILLLFNNVCKSVFTATGVFTQENYSHFVTVNNQLNLTNQRKVYSNAVLDDELYNRNLENLRPITLRCTEVTNFQKIREVNAKVQFIDLIVIQHCL